MKLLDQLVEERAEITEAQTGLVNRAADEERDLTETEDKNLKDLATRAEELDARITELRDVQVSNLEAAKLKAEVQDGKQHITRLEAKLDHVGLITTGRQAYTEAKVLSVRAYDPDDEELVPRLARWRHLLTNP